jgi:hypothetical protein
VLFVDELILKLDDVRIRQLLQGFQHLDLRQTLPIICRLVLDDLILVVQITLSA